MVSRQNANRASRIQYSLERRTEWSGQSCFSSNEPWILFVIHGFHQLVSGEGCEDKGFRVRVNGRKEQ